MCAEKNGHVMLVRQIEEFEQVPNFNRQDDEKSRQGDKTETA